MVASADGPVLIAGGDRDPNLATLIAAFGAAGVPTRALLVGARSRPWLTWDLDADALIVDGEAVEPRAAFVRHDVFTQLADPRPQPGQRAIAWSTALQGWLLAHPHVRCLNRAGSAGPSNKPYVLALARAVGLAIPRTLVTNHVASARTIADAIAKPVAGGSLTRTLDDAVALAGAGSDAVLPAPALVQDRLIAPELRIFVIGAATHAFEIRSRHLDYRAADDAEVDYLGPGPSQVAAQVVALARRCDLDYAAADLKSRADGTLVFLELNTAPMFARFDLAAGGALARALIAWLTS